MPELMNTRDASRGSHSAVAGRRGGLGRHSHLEPGVRRLVQLCVDVLGCTACDGCEGHPPTNDSGLSPRQVRIVPRDYLEHAKLRVLLRRCAARANSADATSSRVMVEIRASDPDPDPLSPRPAIDIVFAPQPGLAPRDYFAHLAISYAQFCRQLSGDADDSPPCDAAFGTPAGRPRDLTSRELVSAARQFYDTALSWHCSKAPVAPGADGSIAGKALHLHAMNFALWHHEDAIRRPGVDEHEVARRKRLIDDLNAARNAAIEDIDETVVQRCLSNRNRGAALHTETPGMIVDRLSVLTLRNLHANRCEQPGPRLAVLGEQYDDLLGGLGLFLARLEVGDLSFKVYRQFKSAEQRGYCALFETRDG
jgi:Protein of unknown function (DUF4254)